MLRDFARFVIKICIITQLFSVKMKDGAVVELAAIHNHHSPKPHTRGITGSNPCTTSNVSLNTNSNHLTHPHTFLRSSIVGDYRFASRWTPHTIDVAQSAEHRDPKHRLLIHLTHMCPLDIANAIDGYLTRG